VAHIEKRINMRDSLALSKKKHYFRGRWPEGKMRRIGTALESPKVKLAGFELSCLSAGGSLK